MDGINDYLQKRAGELGLERGDQLTEIQAELDKLYPGQCRAVSIDDGVLRVVTSNSSLASEIRFRNTEITRLFSNKDIHIQKIMVSIRHLYR